MWCYLNIIKGRHCTNYVNPNVTKLELAFFQENWHSSLAYSAWLSGPAVCGNSSLYEPCIVCAWHVTRFLLFVS